MTTSAPGDPLFRPLTIAEAQAATGRSRRTIARWIAEGRLTAYEEAHPRRVILVERDVIEAEKATRRAARRGRPRREPSEKPDDDPGVDAGQKGGTN